MGRNNRKNIIRTIEKIAIQTDKIYVGTKIRSNNNRRVEQGIIYESTVHM